MKALLVDIVNQIDPGVCTKRDKKYNCDDCDYTTIDNYHLKRHIEIMHNPTQVQCLKCKEVFVTKFKYNQHSILCYYLCPYFGCNKKFKIDYQLEAHRRKHIKMLRKLI